MPTSYPGSLDNFTNPTGTDQTDSVTVPHATQHADLNDAVEAVQAELGTTPSGSSATVKARLDATDPEVVQVLVSDPNGSALTTGDGKAWFMIPAKLNGWNLTAAHAGVTTVSSSGLPTIQIHNATDGQDMLSTRITIDVSEFTSYTALNAPVINTSFDDVATGDRIRIDVDTAGTGTKGLLVALTFTAP